MKILDGKKSSLTIQQELAQKVEEKVSKGLKTPFLVRKFCGDDVQVKPM